MKNEELDMFISSNLDKQELEVPFALQESVRRRAAALAMTPRRRIWRPIVIWGSLAAAALLLVVISLPRLFPPQPTKKKIAQIRTEFSIPEKNIKIVWVQRDDFHLTETKG